MLAELLANHQKRKRKTHQRRKREDSGPHFGASASESRRRAFFRAALSSCHTETRSEIHTDLLKTAFSPIVCAGIERVPSEALKYGEPLFFVYSGVIRNCTVGSVLLELSSPSNAFPPTVLPRHEKNTFSDEIVSSCVHLRKH